MDGEQKPGDPVGVVRSLFELGNRAQRGDHGAARLWYELLDPEIGWEMGTGESIPGFAAGYRGHEGVARFFTQWLEEWRDYESVLHEVELVNGRVLARASMRGRGRASGATVEWPHFEVWDVVDGRATAMKAFATRDEALEEIDAGS